MSNKEAVNWIINLSADIGKAQHQDLWHYEQALSEIKGLLEVEPERKTGKWLKTQYPFEQCSVCGAYFDTSNNQANYCCVCGAKMEEQE